MAGDFIIRKARADDREAITDICVRTADKGDDGRHCFSRPEYPALLWALPYLALEPEHAFVIACEGRVVGYAVGTADTTAFAAKLEKAWWPDIRRQLEGLQPVTPDDRYVFDYVRWPEAIPPAIADRYPAHLHINLLPEAQGHGRGTELLAMLLGALAQSGASGVHLGVNHQNETVTRFYRKQGFTEIARLPSIILAKPLG